MCTSLDPRFRHGARRPQRQLLRHRRLRRHRLQRPTHLPHRALPTEHHRTVGRLADPGRHRVRRRHRSESARCGVDRRRRAAPDSGRTGVAAISRRPTGHAPFRNCSRPAGSAEPTAIAVRCGERPDRLRCAASPFGQPGGAARRSRCGAGIVRRAVDAAGHRHGGGAGGHHEGRRRVLPDRSRLSGGAQAVHARRRRARRSWWQRSKPSTPCRRVRGGQASFAR